MALSVEKSETNTSVRFQPLAQQGIETYIEVGLQSYNEHYLHLWKNQDASAFIHKNLTNIAVEKALDDPKQYLYLIYLNAIPVGILKLTLDSKKGTFLDKSNVLLNKIYLLRAYSGKGLGKQALQFAEAFAKRNRRPWIWLLAMQKGRASQFYQKHGYQIVGESEVELPNILKTEKAMWSMAKKV